ncbi:hypothetical protein E8P82_02915 [Arthrobacter echini]|uniref:Uncharacterized protein n=1 Tax=Arthrobacter echini TaxID=1529066 RepID=A0A4S5E895_9MICC|nr:hypothetical protein [Arthrobacter echini]THJ67804.1 hypothetical protein E8P82_02915 [Arthrobacter echini]
MEQHDQSGTDDLYVVRVLNERELAISGGSAAGVYEHQLYSVLAPGEKLEDPKTGEVLGELLTAKALVKVYEVSEKFALARTFRSKRVKVSGGLALGVDLFNPPKYETRTETLVRGASYDSSSKIAVEPGDPVKRWDGPEDEAPSTSVLS